MTEHREVARRQVAQWFPVASARTAGLAGACAALLLGLAGSARAQGTSLTIYQDGRVVVRRAIAVAVPRGVSTLPVALGARNVDPATLVALDDGVEIRGATQSAATGLEASLRRAVGHDLEFMVPRGDSGPRFVRATLLALDPQTVRLGGRVLYTFPGTPAFPDSLVSLAPQVEVTVAAERAQRSLRIAYLANGLQWRASYALVLPRDRGGRGSVAGYATIEDPGGLTFQGAEVQLLAGEVRRASPSPRPYAEGMAVLRAAAVAAPPTEQAVGETHVYTLAGTVDLEPGVTRTVALFPRADVTVEPEYVLRHPSFVFQSRQDQPERDVHAEVSYLVRRPRATAFGDAPLPAGVVRVLAPDSAGRLQLVGEAQIEHTPAGRELHLVTGTAFDITAQRTQLTFEPGAKRSAVSSYRVTIQNAKSDSVTVQVLDEFPGRFDVLSSSVPAERLSASSVRFPVRVPAGGEATLEYRVRVRW
jgi:hypothetical protein